MRRPSIQVLCFFSIAVAGGSAHAGGVRILSAAGDGPLQFVQEAIDAAEDGDVLLIGQGGVYPGFRIEGKGLTLLAVPGVEITVEHPIEIVDLPPDSTVVLHQLTVNSAEGVDAVHLIDCEGAVRIQDCSFRGGESDYDDVGPGDGLVIDSCRNVVIVGSLLRGGPNHGPLEGGAGLRSFGSSWIAYDTRIRGGFGSSPGTSTPDGGPGCASSQSWFHVAGGDMLGGDGNDNCDAPTDPGSGGPGLVIDHPATALHCVIRGGAGHTCLPPDPPPAPDIVGDGLVQMSGIERIVELAPQAGDRRTLRVTAHGVAGDRVHLLASRRPAFEDAPTLSGAWTIERPETLDALPHALIGASGAVEFDVQLPTLPERTLAEPIFLQALIVDAAQRVRLGSSRHLLLVRTRATPDCDGDGVQDHLAVLEGSAPDGDGDRVPDSCEWHGSDWHVDASAVGPGSGAPWDPLPALGTAFVHAGHGHTIRVEDGVYAGPANRNLDFQGRELTVESRSGASSAVIDCESAGRAFLVRGGSNASGVLRGLTIRNGDASETHFDAERGEGGAVFVGSSGELLVEGCAFADNRAHAPAVGYFGAGGGIHAGDDTDVDVLDSTFTGNSASEAGGGIYMRGSLSVAYRVRGCTFEDNAVTAAGPQDGGGALASYFGNPGITLCRFQGNSSNSLGGAVLMKASQGVVILSHSTLIENQAERGGGIALQTLSDHVTERIHDCLIAGNVAVEGGGIMKFGQASFELLHCTLVGNRSQSPGAAMIRTSASPSSSGLTSVLVSNCVLWRNTGPGGYQYFDPTPLQSRVRWSDVMGGADGLGGDILLGPGLIQADPIFVDPDGADDEPLTIGDNDYHLAPASPCIDAGKSEDIPLDELDVDADGDASERNPFDLDLLPRRVDDPAVPDTGPGAPAADMGTFERQP